MLMAAQAPQELSAVSSQPMRFAGGSQKGDSRTKLFMVWVSGEQCVAAGVEFRDPVRCSFFSFYPRTYSAE